MIESPDSCVQDVVDKVREACGWPERPVHLHGPCLKGRELQNLADCIDTEWVSTGGAFVTELEQKLERFTGARHAIATVNGTSALHIALMLAGVGPGDEVLTPSLAFVASCNAVSYCGGVPHFCDIDNDTLGIDPQGLADHLARIATRRHGQTINRETGRRIAALLPIHTLGHPSHLDELLDVCGEWDIPLIEDAAESIGSYYKGKHTGTLGLCGALSFNSNKIVTTGGGGAILTNDSKLAARAKHLSTTAKLPHAWEFIHDAVGYNYRMPNINAALGCAQLDRLPGFLLRKRVLAKRYLQVFAKVDYLRVQCEPEFCRSNYWLNTLILEPGAQALRDPLLQALNDAGLQSRPVWRPMHLLDIYAHCPRTRLDKTEEAAQRIVNVPSGPALISP